MMSLSLKGRFLFTFFIVQYDPIWGGSIQAIIFDYVTFSQLDKHLSFPSLISFQIGFSITSASMDAMDSNLKGQFSHPFFHFPVSFQILRIFFAKVGWFFWGFGFVFLLQGWLLW